MNNMKLLASTVALAFSISSGSAHAAGTLIAAGDEWLLTENAYTASYVGGTTAFVNNIAATFGGSNYLVLTGNSVTGGQAGVASFAGQLTSLGKTVSYSVALPADLSGYDAVFHIGQGLASTAGLDSYVAGGGNLYVSLGSGHYAGAAGEANFWNPFLANYGLVAGSTWFTSGGFENATVTSGPTGVTNLLWGYGQSIEAIPSTSGVSYVRGTLVGGPQDIGLVGTSKMLVDTQAVPEPASWAMMIGGFAIVGAAMRRRTVSIRFA